MRQKGEVQLGQRMIGPRERIRTHQIKIVEGIGQTTHRVNGDTIGNSIKRVFSKFFTCSVVKFPLHEPSFSCQQLYQFSHSHTRGEPVRIHDHIRRDSVIIERKILLIDNQTCKKKIFQTKGNSQECFGKALLLVVLADHHAVVQFSFIVMVINTHKTQF